MMIDTPLLATYLVAITLLTVTPGVDTLLIIRSAARGGWRDGVVSSVGICSGLFMHAVISAVGISVLLIQTSWAFSGLKLCGALYLIWLGVCNWRTVFNSDRSLFSDRVTTGSRSFIPLRSLREGFLSNILNPKTVIFYMAFLPHFIDPTKSALLQSLLLAGFHFVIAMIWQSALALAVNQAKTWLQRPQIYKLFASLTGTVLVGFGIKLAINH